MASGFVPNAAGYREFLHSEPLAADMKRRGEAVAAAAQASAVRESGDYADSVAVIVEDHPSRVVAHVSASVPYAAAIEARTGNLARALDAAAS